MLSLAAALSACVWATGCLGDDDEAAPGAAREVTHESALLTGSTEASYRYRLAGSRAWQRSLQARISGLRPGTRYVYEACTGRGPAAECGPPDGESAESGRFQTRLRYPPPELDSPTTVSLDSHPDYCENSSPTGGDGGLDDAKDYVIELPSTPLECSLDVRGGRNVVIKGGDIRIPNINESPRNPELHRGLYLSNQTGTIHVEGVRLSGDELSVPIVLNQGRGATVQLQQIRAERIFTDYPNWGPLHADCIQTWSGPNVLRVDGYTCSTDYFGLQLSPTQYSDDENNWPDLMEFRHMNFRPWRRPDDLTRFMFWRTRVSPRTEWWPMTFDDVWTEPGYQGGGTDSALTCYSAQFKATIPANGGVWEELSSDQSCASWPRFSYGQPPGGDFVRARDVGVGYRTPGY